MPDFSKYAHLPELAPDAAAAYGYLDRYQIAERLGCRLDYVKTYSREGLLAPPVALTRAIGRRQRLLWSASAVQRLQDTLAARYARNVKKRVAAMDAARGRSHRTGAARAAQA